jgi:hypothetical protein
MMDITEQERLALLKNENRSLREELVSMKVREASKAAGATDAAAVAALIGDRAHMSVDSLGFQGINVDIPGEKNHAHTLETELENLAKARPELFGGKKHEQQPAGGGAGGGVTWATKADLVSGKVNPKDLASGKVKVRG